MSEIPRRVFNILERFGLTSIGDARRVKKYFIIYVTLHKGKLRVMGVLADGKYSVPDMRSLAASVAVGALASRPFDVPTHQVVNSENTRVIGEIPMRGATDTAGLVVYTTCRLHNGSVGNMVYYHVSLDSAAMSNTSVAFVTQHGPLNTKECPVLTAMLAHLVIHGIENPP